MVTRLRRLRSGSQPEGYALGRLPTVDPTPLESGRQRICTGMMEKMAVDHGHGSEGSLRKWNYNRGDDCEKAHSVRLRLFEAFRRRKGYPDYPCENNGC